ncbi:type II secretion system F family protein [Paenibacillus macerans]|uniref:Type II secretion system (T2SS), F family protein n=1 Tax=Paenibacillus macerans TaxID=44252 RepID=A0A090Z9D3_PAEMA|nr:type II secretion system F family protein [Paenibacillus macerans]KFN00936.1 type II secretion system (T2SS), F family protein [Paenibacillus macerans]MCY7556710.1 type II secretion system F family protein [Paenibacillus macerans]MEC0150835.1 type II secretion system F family protein [Paenibacillus macerans]SUA85090.1 Flp pilus assembly protein TadB [Paenibacillus macerans]
MTWRTDVFSGERNAAGGARSEGLADYRVYVLTGRQKALCMLLGGAALFAVGCVFFHSIPLALGLSAGALFVPKPWSRHLLRKRRENLSLHFKQALYSLSSSLAAGRSVENGFREAIDDLKLLYPDGDNDLIRELGIICARMEYGQPVEEALLDFSRRAGMEDISNFADVFTTCKRSGGDLVDIVRRTSALISEKLEIGQEISVMIAQKRFEAKAMLAAPILFLLFMEMTSPDYMQPLHSGVGLLISAAALLVFAGSSWLMLKIVDIRV